jgi:hypothetical protein
MPAGGARRAARGRRGKQGLLATGLILGSLSLGAVAGLVVVAQSVVRESAAPADREAPLAAGPVEVASGRAARAPDATGPPGPPEPPEAPEPPEPPVLPAPPARAGRPVTGQLLETLGDLLQLPRFRPEPAEAAALGRLARTMPGLAGEDRLFNRGDVEAIVASLAPEIASEVNRQIVHRAAGQVRHGELGWWLRAFDVRRHLDTAGDQYFKQGLARADRLIRDGLSGFLARLGVTASAPDRQGARDVSLAMLRRFTEDASVLDQLARRCARLGLPRSTFPRGIGAEDLEAMQHGRLPLNATLRSSAGGSAVAATPVAGR